MDKYFFYAGAIGWMLLVIIHLAALGGIDVQTIFPFVWIMHIAVFPIFFVAIKKLKKNPELAAYKEKNFLTPKNPMTMPKMIFSDTPRWMITLVVLSFGYAILNFFLFALNQYGEAAIEGGRYVLQSKGHTIREISYEEYTRLRANMVRGFSGHWILFYGIATALLYPSKPIEKVD